MRFTQVGKFQPLMGWHQAGPGHGVQPLSRVQSSPNTHRLGHLLSALDSTRALMEGIFRGKKQFCHAEMLLSDSPSPGSPAARPYRIWAASRHSSTLGLLVRSSSRV